MFPTWVTTRPRNRRVKPRPVGQNQSGGFTGGVVGIEVLVVALASRKRQKNQCVGCFRCVAGIEVWLVMPAEQKKRKN